MVRPLTVLMTAVDMSPCCQGPERARTSLIPYFSPLDFALRASISAACALTYSSKPKLALFRQVSTRIWSPRPTFMYWQMGPRPWVA